MVESIYLAATEAASGKSAVALALLEHLGRRVGRVLPFRPIVPAVGEDALLDVLRARLGPESPPTEDLCGVSYEEVHADLDAAMSDIVDRFHAVADRCDLVLVIGSDFSDIATPTEFSVNARIAANLGARMVLVLPTGERPGRQPGRTHRCRPVCSGRRRAGRSRPRRRAPGRATAARADHAGPRRGL